jgi:hypothetical protein
LAVGDLTGDGIPDLVTNNGEIVISRGVGDGTFVLLASTPAAESFALAVGDFNGDGKLDVVSSEYGGAHLFLGAGDGTLSAQPVLALDYRSTRYVTADFNGDGILDIAGSGGVLLGGKGGLTRGAEFPAGVVAAGDFNGDGRMDLAILRATTVTVLLGAGDGTFTPGPTLDVAPDDCYNDLGVGDFDGDGKLDLVTVSNWQIGVLLGNGDGSFKSQALYSYIDVGFRSLAVGDFNSDGRLDLAVGGLSNGDVALFLGLGDGTFLPDARYLAEASGIYSVAASDLNRDGRLDLVASSGGSGSTVSILLNHGTACATHH